MKLSKKQCDFILGSQFCILATSDKNNQPRSCIVIPERAYDDKVVIADCQMGRTRENVLANNKVFVSFYDNELDWCMKCEGTAEYVQGGANTSQLKKNLQKTDSALPELSPSASAQFTNTKKMLDEITAAQKEKGYKVQGLIIVTIENLNMCK